jgi:SAM-dependent methyltransferase
MISAIMPTSSIYDSLRMAAGYAYARPPVHGHMIEAMRQCLGTTSRFHQVLDIGCGAGLSTAALEPYSDTVIGLEPAPAMLTFSHFVSPHALFLVGRAERLPFRDGMFDLLTAAGSLNYVNLALSLPEAVRVLAPGGRIVIYDFSEGRRLRGSYRLAQWFSEFQRRYPPPPDYDLDIRSLPYDRLGLRLEGYRDIAVPIMMSLASYVPYVMSETSVEAAIARGVPEPHIRGWCSRTLREVFGDAPLEVLFDGYIAWARKV